MHIYTYTYIYIYIHIYIHIYTHIYTHTMPSEKYIKKMNIYQILSNDSVKQYKCN